jgi:hypothetical protein
MSFESTLVLKNAAAVDQNFIRINPSDPTKSTFMQENSTLSLPESFVIGHQMAKSPRGVDRHLVKASISVEDTAEAIVMGSVATTITVPRTGITRAHVNDMLARQIDFLSDPAIVDKIMRGEA